MDNQIPICLHIEQAEKLPATGNHILANYNEETIIVYQAYNNMIADKILKNKNFHCDDCIISGYNLNRTTWIKPSFLWMMYRSGWGTKSDQERILALRITRSGFEEILRNAVYAFHDNTPDARQKLKDSNVVLQWDPDRNPDGSKILTGRRAIQLGIRGEMLLRLSKEFLVDVYDLTHFVQEQNRKISCDYENGLKNLEVPVEKIYLPNDESIIKKIKNPI